MNTMKVLVSLIVLYCLFSSPAETVSVFRLYNPFSWFASSANRTTLNQPFTSSTESQNSGTANSQNNTTTSSLAQNSSELSPSAFPARESLSSGLDKIQDMLLAVTPLKIEPLQIHDNETTDVVNVLVPTHVAPVMSSETHSVKRFGLIREQEIREGREEIELQTTTVTATPELRKEDPGKKTGTESAANDAKPTPPSSGPGTSESTLPPLTTTTTAIESGTTSEAVQSERLHGQENGDEIPAATTDPSASITTTTTAINRSSESESEMSTLPSPVYVSSGSEQHLKLQLTEDFVRFLNRHYYEKPLFNEDIAGLR